MSLKLECRDWKQISLMELGIVLDNFGSRRVFEDFIKVLKPKFNH